MKYLEVTPFKFGATKATRENYESVFGNPAVKPVSLIWFGKHRAEMTEQASGNWFIGCDDLRVCVSAPTKQAAIKMMREEIANAPKGGY